MCKTRETQCDECDGAGERCGVCGEHPENCDCEGGDVGWIECEHCNGTGIVEEDEDDDVDEDEELESEEHNGWRYPTKG